MLLNFFWQISGIFSFHAETIPQKDLNGHQVNNLAAEEISVRVGEQHRVSTIHSFLNDLIGDYKKNIHSFIFEIFEIKKILRENIDIYPDIKTQNKKEHEKYKKLYLKYAKKLYSIKKETTEKVLGKTAYDIDPIRFNDEFNIRVDALNKEIFNSINQKHYNSIRYNDTRFDSLKDLTYGHDSLLVIASLLFKNFNLMGRILVDKYDFIFVDEYQDTNELIIDIFLNQLPKDNTIIIGFFGDSMQGIYEDGVGDVKSYIENGHLKLIEKEDNYRCSQEVIDFINNYRNDNLSQKIALRNIAGVRETPEDRQGGVYMYYSKYKDKKPTGRSSPEDKTKYLSHLTKLISAVEDKHPNYKKIDAYQ